MKLASKLSHKLSRKLAIKPFGYSSSSSLSLAIPASLKQLLFHDNNVAQPTYYTPQELAGSGLPHDAFLKDYSLGLGDLRPKQPGYCYNFDGVNDYVDIPGLPILGPNLSISLWVSAGSFNNFDILFGQGSTNLQNGKILYFMSDGTLRATAKTYIGELQTAVLSLNTWYHAVFTRNESGDRVLYLNGVLVDNDNTPNFDNSGITGGRLGGLGVYYGNAKLSDVQIYNYALTAQQVADLYAGTLPATKPIAHYPLQEQSGPRAYDISGNGNHGTIMNATTSGVGSIHVTDTGVKKSYSNDEGYTDGLVLSYGDILDSTFAATDAYFEIEWEGEIPPNDGISRAVLSKNADSNFSENQRQFGVRWVGNKLGGLYFTDLSGTKVRGYETDAGVTSGSTFKVIYDGSLDADSRMSFYVDDVLVPASVTVTAGTITSTDDIKNSTAPLAIGSSANVAQTQYIPSSVGFYHTSVTIRDASSTIFSASRANNWKDTVGNITPTVIHNRKIPNVSDTESAIGTTPQFTGRVPQYGLAKGPAWQGDGSSVYVDLGSPIIPATADFELEFWYLHKVSGTARKGVFEQLSGSDNYAILVNNAVEHLLQLYIDFADATSIVNLANSSLVLNEWHRIVSGRVGSLFYIRLYSQTNNLLWEGTATRTTSSAINTSSSATLLRYNPGSFSNSVISPVTLTTGGVTTTYSPIQGTRNVAVTKSDGTYSIINNAVVNGTLANLYSTGNGSWKLPAIENGANWDGTSLIPAAPGAEVAANGNAINIPANKHPRSVLVDRTGAVITPLDTAMGTDDLTNETWEQGVAPLGKRHFTNYSDRHGAGLVDISALDYFEPRAFVARVGTSTSPTSVGTKAVTGVGFQPKVILPFGNSLAASGVNTSLDMALGSAVSSSNRACVSVSSVNAVTTSDTDRLHTSTLVYELLFGGFAFLRANLETLDSDGFTLNWSTASPTARILNHIALGGTDLEVSLTQHQMNTGTPDQVFPHGLSGEPTAILLFTTFNVNLGTTTDLNLSLGLFANNVHYGAAIQARNSVSTTITRRILSERFPIQSSSSGGFIRFGNNFSVDATNLEFSTEDTNGNPLSPSNYNISMLAIRGAKAQVGTFDCNGSLDPLTIATPGITPKLFLPVFVPGGVDNIGTVINDLALTIGASDGTNNVSCGITDQNGLVLNPTTTNARRYQSSTSFAEYDNSGNKLSEMTAGFNSESVVITPSLANAARMQGGYLILGE